MTAKLGICYLLLFSMGMLGGHRIFLGKWFTGIVYMLTGGLFGIGLIYDLFALPSLVRASECECA